MKFEEWLAQQDDVIEVECGCVTTEAFYHWMRVAYEAGNSPVVPDDVSIFEAAIEECKTCDSIDEHAWNHGVLAVIAKYESCRAAMLQELKKSAGTEAICRSDENVQVLHTKSPAQSDCCPAQNSVTPAQGGNSLVIPDEMTSGQAYEIGYYYGDPVDVFARGANWMRQHIIDSTLAASPQSPGSEPATVPGKWIPVSERMPENDGAYLCWDNRYVTTYAFIFGAWQANQFIAKNITHWMPLPAGPQEVR